MTDVPFKTLPIGARFTFPKPPTFGHICEKISPRGYSWTVGNLELHTRVGSINVKVSPL